MAKKRKNKIEENYKRFSRMTPEKLGSHKGDLEEQLRDIEDRILNKEKELEGRQSTIDLTTNPDKKDILSAQKETAEKELEDLKIMKEQKIKEIRTIDNYANNKGKIEKVLGYKEQLSKKLKLIKAEKRSLSTNLKDKKSEEKEIDKKLKKSEEMNNDEYNTLMKQKEELRREIEKAEKALEETNKRIETLTGSVSKCDLVWKNLMLGKSWDEIHVKAIRMSGKGTPVPGKGKEPEDEDFRTETDTEEKADRFVSLLEKFKQRGQGGLSDAPTQPLNKETTKSMTEYDEFAKKHPRLAKIRDFFKNMINKKENKEQKSKPVQSTQRDEFVEQLRMMVDKEYKDEVRGAKEAEYREAHKLGRQKDVPQQGDDSNQR